MSEKMEMTSVAEYHDADANEASDATDESGSRKNKIYDCKIDPILLNSKLFYFFFFGGLGAVLPYLTIYYKQLGMDPLRLGLVGGIRPFIGFLSGPLWGAIADKYRIRKLMLMFSLCGWITMILVLGFVPPAKEGECPVAANVVGQYLNETNGSTAINVEMSRRRTRSRSTTDLARMNFRSSVEIYLHAPTLNNAGKSRDLSKGRKNIFARSADRNFSDEIVSEIEVMTNEEDRSWLYDHNSLLNLFLLLMTLTMAGEFMQSPTSALADTATLNNLGGGNMDKYGHQIVWGAIGWGTASFAVGALVNLTRHTTIKCGIELVFSDYRVAFYCFAALMIGAFIVAVRLKFKDDDNDESSKHSLASLIKLLSKIQYFSVLAVGCFVGICNGVVYGFIFWHLENLGASQLLMGTCSFVSSVSQIILFFLSHPLLTAIGNVNILYLGLLCYALKFLIYALVTNPWWVLPAEALHGLTGAAVWTSLSTYLAFIVPSESFATMQGILHGVHWGLGSGVGNMLGGVLVDEFGAVITFFVFSVINIVVLGLFFCIQKCCPSAESTVDGYNELEGLTKEEVVKKQLD
ncbi:major facilitator superfamily domain-containing protein 6-like [Saccoglossus kowalevskii]